MGALRTTFAVFGWMTAALIGMMFVGLFILILAVFSGGIDEDELSPLTVKTDHGVGVVELTGEILTSTKFSERLKRLVEHEKIKGIVVRIDSPGGTVGASEEMNRLIREADKKKPTICSLGNMAASGGLYAAVACRKIVTNSGTLTGSIGVLLAIPNVANAIDRVGFKMNTIKSGKFKDSGSPFRPFESEEQALMQSLVNSSYEQFVRAIAEGRKLETEAVKKFADGRIILGEQAVQLGLADEVGGLERAAKIALEQSGNAEAEPEIVLPKTGHGMFRLFEDISESKLWTFIRSVGQVRLLYQFYG